MISRRHLAILFICKSLRGEGRRCGIGAMYREFRDPIYRPFRCDECARACAFCIMQEEIATLTRGKSIASGGERCADGRR